MDYEKHYKTLCSSRQKLNRKRLSRSDPDYCYYEKHHIIPLHENGPDEEWNFVLLTGREHFIAHWLFAKWKQTPKAYHALGKIQHGIKRKLNSKQYEICKLAHSKAMHLCNPMSKLSGEAHFYYGKNRSDEQRKKQSAAMLGKPAWNKGIPCSDKQKLKISAANKGRKKSKIQAENEAKTKLNNKLKRLSNYGAIAIEHKEHGAILLADAQCMLDFCKKTGTIISCLEKLIKAKNKSTKGWILCKS